MVKIFIMEQTPTQEENINENIQAPVDSNVSSARNFSKGDILSAFVIGEAVAWLLFIMVKVNAPELPIPSGLAESLSSIRTALVLAVALPILSIVGLYVAYLLSSALTILYRIAKFILVGALNTFVDLGILNAFILFYDVAEGTPLAIFKGLSFTVAVVNSYFWNKFWTFKSKEGDRKKEFIQFLVVSVIGLFVNVGTVVVLVNVIGAPGDIAPTLWVNIAALSATAASLAWNFIGYKFWVFKVDSSQK